MPNLQNIMYYNYRPREPPLCSYFQKPLGRTCLYMHVASVATEFRGSAAPRVARNFSAAASAAAAASAEDKRPGAKEK